VGLGVQVGGKIKPRVAAISTMMGFKATGAGRPSNSGKKKKAIIQIKMIKPKTPMSRTHCSAFEFLRCLGE
jgi:hypothetical protein